MARRAPLEIDIVRPLDLATEDVAAWSELQVRRRMASPFLSPHWPRYVAEADGPDAERARVAVIRRNGQPEGFMAARVGRLTARPVGAPMSDYQALVGEGRLRLDPRRLVRAFGVQRLDFTHLLTSQVRFAPYMRGRDSSLIISVAKGFDAYAAAQRAHSDILIDTAKKRRKLERDKGPVEFAALSPADIAAQPEVFDSLLRWKRAQYAATRQTDIFSAGWPERLLRRLMTSEEPDFGASVFTLRAGGELAAVHYALRGSGVLHTWFIAHSDAFQRYSPGVVLMVEMMRWAAANGLPEIDLGPGDYRFKHQLANARRGVAWGFIGRPSTLSLARQLQYDVRGVAEALPLGRVSALPGKAMRRLDLITALR